MRTNELLDGRRVRGVRGGGGHGLEESEKVSAVLDWEEGCGVCDYVGVLAVAKVETETKTSRGGVGIGVGDVGNAGGV